MKLKFILPNMKSLFFTLSFLFISGCASTPNIYERHEKANELEAQAEEARVRNNYSMATQLDRKAENLREKDITNKEDIVSYIFSGLFQRLLGGSSKSDKNDWR
ncbi:hypothetical protein BTJ40_05675 [Microbulbifer sp. A4B17]|nr:hypothetical protein BTJ40_05675 [Microbulbifer sp. A4B17]